MSLLQSSLHTLISFPTLLYFRAIEKLSGHQFEDYSFKISYIPDEEVNSPSPPHRAREQGHSPGSSSQARQIDFPLRILVPTQFVGAIIGKEGLTIKNITKQTQSRYVPLVFPLLPSEGSPASCLSHAPVLRCCSGRLSRVGLRCFQRANNRLTSGWGGCDECSC